MDGGLLCVDVEAGSHQPLALERVGQRVLVDDRTARGVDQDRIGFKEREPLGVQKAARLVGKGRWTETTSAAPSASFSSSCCAPSSRSSAGRALRLQ